MHSEQSHFSPFVRPFYTIATILIAVIIALTWTRPGATASGDIVFYVAKAPQRVGSWRVVSDTSAAGGARLEQPNAGAAASDDGPRVAGALRGVFRHRPGQHAVSPVAARQGVSEFWRQRLGVGADIGDHRRERKRDLSHRHHVSDDGQSRGLLGVPHQQLDVG